MTATRFVRPALIAVLAAAVFWQVNASTARNDLFGVNASIGASHLELRVKLPAICLRLYATLSGFFEASARFLSCDGCDARTRARHWT